LQLTLLVNGCTLSHDNTIPGTFSLEGTAIKESVLGPAMFKKAVGVQAIRRVVVVTATNSSTASAG
jgi:hypothetical protein